MTKKVILPKNLIEKLEDLPEHGMGYQRVTVSLKNGKILSGRIVVNTTYLVLLENEKIKTKDIESVELDI
jgi:small nuclear ribonucleoprotein (snRNP)-like protein